MLELKQIEGREVVVIYEAIQCVIGAMYVKYICTCFLFFLLYIICCTYLSGNISPRRSTCVVFKRKEKCCDIDFASKYF